jgi:nitroreductase/NAD-dependent dihydropyrimidine dehydrogenase PreA subunit
MMITLDKGKCKKCGLCIDRMKGYCISENDSFPVFDESLCNTCQKCVSICPFQAIMVNNKYSEKVILTQVINPDDLYKLFERRRSIKKFTTKPLSKEVICQVVSVAKFAPNQNKNIDIHIIDDQGIIKAIDECSVLYVKRIYNILFRFRMIEAIIKIFYKDIETIKRKMEHGSFKRVIYENAQVIVILSGNKHIAVTQNSAHYMLSTIMYMAESLGIGSCLMDSVCLALNNSKKIKRYLKINNNVLGVLILGYSNENVQNIPKGYEVKIVWNN